MTLNSRLPPASRRCAAPLPLTNQTPFALSVTKTLHSERRRRPALVHKQQWSPLSRQRHPHWQHRRIYPRGRAALVHCPQSLLCSRHRVLVTRPTSLCCHINSRNTEMVIRCSDKKRSPARSPPGHGGGARANVWLRHDVCFVI